MKKFISLMLILSLLMSTTNSLLLISAYAENENGSTQSNLEEDAGKSVTIENIYNNENNTETLSHEEANLLHEKMEKQENSGNEKEISLFSEDSGYSEVVYIYSDADLRSIDGHSGGYYELKRDINVGNWDSICLYGATINGNGHTINMRIRGTKSEGDFVGLISGTENYIADLTLKFNIDVTVNGGYVIPLGFGYAHNCTLIGNMNVKIATRYDNMDDPYGVRTMWTDYIYGINSGSGNRYIGNINVCGDIVYYGYESPEKPGSFDVYVLYNCIDSSFKGDIKVLDCRESQHESWCWVSQANLYCISGDSHNSHIKGDIYTTVSMYGIQDSSECSIKGDITANLTYEAVANILYPSHYGDWSFFLNTVRCIEKSKDSYINGKIRATGDYAEESPYPMDNDRIHSLTGISRSESCYIRGDITTKQMSTFGMATCNSCYIKGDITAYDVAAGSVNGITGSNCILYGSLYAEYTRRIGTYKLIGIGGVANVSNHNSKITGSVRLVDRKARKSVTKTGGTQPTYICYPCTSGIGRKTNGVFISENNENNTHLSSYIGCGKCYTDVVYLDAVYYEFPDQANGNTVEDPIPEKPINFSIKVINALSGQPVVGAEVVADGTTAVTDNDGIANFHQSNRIGGLHIKSNGRIVYSEIDYIANKGVNSVWVTDVHIDKDSFNFGNNASETITGAEIDIAGKKLPVINQSMEFDLDLFDAVSVAYNPSDNTLEVLMDLKKIHVKDALQKEWAEKYSEFSDVFDEAINGKLDPDKMHRYNKSTGSEGNAGKLGKKLGIDGDVTAQGFLKLKIDENMSVLDGGITIVGSLEKKGTLPVPSAPWCYFAYGLEGSLAAGVEAKLINSTYNTPQFDVNGLLSFSLEPQIGAGFGFKDFLAIEAGIEGELELKTKLMFESFPKSFSAELTASVYALVNALGFEKKEKWNFVDVQIYPPTETVSLMNVSSPADLQIVPRDYLAGDGIALMSEEDGVIKSGLYPYTAVKFADLGYGTKLMVWLDDDTERDLYNKTALYYSVYDGTQWSEPQLVCDDETADFEFELKTVDSKAMLVWQNINSKLTEDDTAATTAEKSELCYMEFVYNVWSGGASWSEPVNITTGNTVYEYNPDIITDRYSTGIVWKSNETNSVFSEFEALPENIHTKELSSDEASTVFEDKIIYDLLCGDNNMAVITDSDDNTETTGTQLYINGTVAHHSNHLISGLSYSNGNFYFHENGNIMKIATDGSEAELFMENANTSARVVNDTTVISENVYGFKSELYVSYLKEADPTDDNLTDDDLIEEGQTEFEWTAPIQLTDFGGRIRSWKSSVDTASGGNISIAAAVVDISEENESVSQNVKLMYKETEPVSDVILTAVYADKILRGENATVNIGIRNNTKETISEFDVKITAGETVLYNSTAELSPLYTGETGYAQVTIDIPEGFEKQEITATVSFTNIEDKNPENNVFTDVWGYSDLETELNGNFIEIDGYAVATVTNKGCETALDTVITLKNEKNEVIYTTDVGEIAPGESVTLDIEVPEQYRTFADGSSRIVYTLDASSSSEETVNWDNKASYILENTIERIVSLNTHEIMLKSGESYSPTVTILPADGNPELYMVSADEDIATVDENGTVTAKNEGITTVSYYTKDAVVSSQLTVIVRNSLGSMKIAEDYKEYSTLYLTVDTTEALNPGETADLMVAIYDANGGLYSVQTYKDVKYSKQVKIDVYYSDGKLLKLFLWNSMNNLMPIAKALTYFDKEVSGDYEYYVKDGYAHITGYLGSNLSSRLYLPTTIGNTNVIAVEAGSFEDAELGGCTLVIPSGIEKIGSRAFYNTNITGVEIPETVTEIGDDAFGGCMSITSFLVSDDNQNYSDDSMGLYNKDKTAFIKFATGLNEYSYAIADGVERIGAGAFEYSTLKEVTIPKSVDFIGKNSFLNTDTKINYCGTREEWNSIEKTHSGISDDRVSFDASSAGDEDYISRFQYDQNSDGLIITGFDNTDFTSETLTIPSVIDGEAVVEIGDFAFESGVLDGVKTVIISEGIEVIGNYAFEGNETIEWFVVPSTTWAILAGAFATGSNLKGFTVADANSNYCSVDGILFNKAKTELICYPSGKTDTYYAVPESIETISVSAFKYAQIKEILLPAGLKTIDEQGLGLMWSLEKITVDDENTEFCSVDGVLFNKDKTTLIQYPIAKGTSYTIPESVVSIGKYAFQLSRLESIYIGTEVKSIDFAAFNCWNMKNIYYKGTEEDWTKIVVGNSNNALTSATIHYNSEF